MNGDAIEIRVPLPSLDALFEAWPIAAWLLTVVLLIAWMERFVGRPSRPKRIDKEDQEKKDD